MFYIEPHDEGYLIRWDTGDEDVAAELSEGVFFAGLRRTRETSESFVVLRYRNDLETFRSLLDVFNEQQLKPDIDPSLVQRQKAGDLELVLLKDVQKGKLGKRVSAKLSEFKSGRKLLDYQQDAVTKHLHVVHSADFSVPGSGKTSVALATWAIARREIPDLGLWVIGPLSSFRPWEDEFLACIGQPPVALRLQGTAGQRSTLLRHANEFELVLTNYHTAWRETEGIVNALNRRPWMLVLDEAHYVKSMTGTLAAAVRRLAPFAQRRLALTGTPMPHSPEDLWSIFTFLWPSEALLGNSFQFAQRCKKPVAEVCEELRHELAPLFHRTTKDSLGLRPVDAKYPIVPSEDLPKTQRLMIRLIEQRTLSEDEILNAGDQRHLRRWRRARIIRLMQVVANPLLLAGALDAADVADATDEEGKILPSDEVTIPLIATDSDLARALARYRDREEIPGKIRYIIDRCRQLTQTGKKVVIWTVFLGNVSLLEQLLSDLRPLVITGAVPTIESEEDEQVEQTREQRITLFKTDPDRRVLIANAAACAESVSLHKACQHALYLERSFNAAHFVQSMDRIHRQGMPPGTTAHIEIPSIPCAIERVLNRRLATRQQVMYRLLDDPMPIVGFDDEAHRGFFDVEDLDDIDQLFAEVIAEIRAESSPMDE